MSDDFIVPFSYPFYFRFLLGREKEKSKMKISAKDNRYSYSRSPIRCIFPFSILFLLFYFIVIFSYPFYFVLPTNVKIVKHYHMKILNEIIFVFLLDRENKKRKYENHFCKRKSVFVFPHPHSPYIFIFHLFLPFLFLSA